MWLSLMPRRQWSRCTWYPASLPLVWEILPGADRLLWVGGGPSVAASNWLTWSGSRHTCEFLTLLGGASPGVGLLLWSLWPSKRCLCSTCWVGASEVMTASLYRWQACILVLTRISCWIIKTFTLWGLDLVESYSSVWRFSICVLSSVWPVLKQKIWKETLFQKSSTCCWLLLSTVSLSPYTQQFPMNTK